VIPDGVVCFFASHAYLEQVYKQWEQNGVVERIRKHKMVLYSFLNCTRNNVLLLSLMFYQIFQEPRETQLVEKVLREYDVHIHSSNNQNGALLLCVVGGKMSEGINFSDRLGR
jgi:chromosome transmission fidelity protein 1